MPLVPSLAKVRLQHLAQLVLLQARALESMESLTDYLRRDSQEQPEVMEEGCRLLEQVLKPRQHL